MQRLSLQAAAAALSLVLSSSLLAQIAPVGTVHPNAQPIAQVATIAMPALDRVAIAQEDEQFAAAGMAARYAIPNPVQVTPDTHGTWELLDAKWSLWRLRIKAPGSDHVNLGFRQFQLPENARMQVYSTDGGYVVRPFTDDDHQPTNQLWTPIVRGEDIVCEVYIPTAERRNMQLQLIHVGSGYRGFGAGSTALQTDGSGGCNIDINCPLGAGWETQASAVAAISTGGSVFCTGCMINNTAEDGRNFFLTAYHCGIDAGAAPSLVCYWNYEASSCNAGNGGLSQFTTGATWRAGYGTSDFTLVELNSTPNPAWDVGYAGWSRSAVAPPSATCIHHPSGDEKKISHEYDPTSIYLTNHIEVADWDDGTTEPGSSGSPLFDDQKRIVGQLEGGAAACGNDLYDCFGRFYISWTGGGTNNSRLSNWLDPIGTGAITLDALGDGGLAAEANPYGTGCYSGEDSFNELFAGGAFDLAGSAIVSNTLVLTPSGGGYQVTAGGNNWFNPLSGDLGLADDGYSTQNLPFTLNYPGGSTTTVKFCSNGFAFLDPAGSGLQWDPTLAAFTGQEPRLAPLWMDLDPTSGGSCHYDNQGNVVYFTWSNLPPYNQSGSNTMQMAIYSNGTIEYRYRAFSNQPNDAILGFTPGATAQQPSIDVSTSLPLSVAQQGLTWTATNRPILGTTQIIQIGNIPNPTLTIPLAVAGFTQIPGGFDLGVVGAGGCNLYTSADVIEVITAGNFWLLTIPNNPSLLGSEIFTQGALLEHVSIALNAGGIRTANAIALLLGNI